MGHRADSFPPPQKHPRVPVTGVSGTALWTFYHRAALGSDPVAVEAMKRLDVPWESVLGPCIPLASRLLTERARLFDREVTDFLVDRPDATVVSLGEGLETQFWRVDNGRLHWLTVDLPKIVELRRTVFPHGNRQSTVGSSVLDARWMDHVRPGTDVLLVAQGLFMYLRHAQVVELIRACAARFPGGSLIFDTVPPWFSALSRLGLLRRGPYRLPPMHFGMSCVGLRSLRAVGPCLSEMRYLAPGRVPGALGFAMANGHRVPFARRALPARVRAEFVMRGGEPVSRPERVGGTASAGSEPEEHGRSDDAARR